MQYITNAFNIKQSWAQVPPSAVATVDQASVNQLTNVTLDGSASSSPEGISISIYNWSEVDTNQPVILVRNGSKATFQAPNVTGPSPVNYTFRLTVTDANGLVSTPSDVNVTVNNMNETTFPLQPPLPLPVELPPHTIGTSPANGSINIPTKADKLTATFDQDIDTISANISLKDTAGNEIPVDVTSDGPTVTITPKSDLNPGTNYTVSIDQINGKGKTNVGSISFGFTTVQEVITPPTPTSENHPPEAQNQQVTTEADKPVDISLGALDNDTGDSLSAEIVTPPQPDHGSLGQIDQNTGNVTYTPAAGFSGNDSFTFKVIDSHQTESNVATISITVIPPVPISQPTQPTQPTQPAPTTPSQLENHPPEAQNQQVTTEADKPVDIALGALDNDTGDSLSAEIVTPPQPDHGSLGQIDQNTGNVTYTPAAGFSGNDSFTFKVIDSHQAESNVATISITVSPLPTPKLIESTPVNGSSDVSATIDKIEATFNDKVNIGSATVSLKDDSGKEIEITTSAQDSKVTISPKSKLSPKTHYTVSFDQIKTENESNPGSASLSFTTTAITNNPPLIEKLNASPSSAKVGDLVMLSVANPDLKDETPSSLALHWQQTSGIPTVNLTLSSDNKTASFTAPEVKQNTPLIFKLTATDEENQTATKDVTVNVMAPPPNQPPEVTITANASDSKPGQGIEMKALVQDEQPLSVKLSWQQTSGIPTVNLTLSSDNKTASFTAPEVKQNTPLIFKLTATDEENQTATKDVTVNVMAPQPNLAPKVSTGPNQNVSSGDFVKLSGTVTDEASPKLMWTQTEGPTSDISLQNSDQREASFISPPVKSPTKLAFNLTATDERNQRGSSKIVITINPVSLENDRDSDNDGIFNNVDKDISKPSVEFLDKFDQTPPQTFGKIIVPKGITSPKVTIKDAANELNGVVISLAPDAPSTVNITACGSSSTVLGKGDIILLTCGSTEIKVIQGDAFTRLNTTDRSFIQGTLTEGNLIIFDPAKRTLKADSDNAAVIDLSVVGNKKMNEIILGAGKVVTVPPSGNAPIPTQTPTTKQPPTTPPKQPPTTPPKQPPTTPPKQPPTTPPKQPPTTPPKQPPTTPPKQPPTTPPKQPPTPTTAPTGQAPTVSISPVPPVRVGGMFVLNGNLSKGTTPLDKLTFQWQQVSGPPAKPVLGQNTAKATYQAPIVNQSGTTLIFKLTAKNSKGVESSSQIPVQILKANSRPVANAGPDQIVRENANVTLDGTKSLDPDKERLTFSWVQTFGVRRVVLNGDDTIRPTFKAPFVPVNNSLLVFRLTVKDSAGLNSSDLVRISVLKTSGGLTDNPPVANAGPDKAVIAGSNVTLNGNKSADPDLKDKLTYVWKQTGGSPLVLLVGSDQPNASFKAPDLSANTTLTFALTVSDGQRKNNTDTVNVTVFKPQGFPLWLIIVIVAAAGGGGAAAWFFFFRKPPKRTSKFVP